MGACNAKDKPTDGQTNRTNQPTPITQSDSLKVKGGDLIQEQIGNIEQFYDILPKPLGQGAYGEVRKAVHLQSGAIRAIKIIKKASQSLQEQQNLKNEVDMLRSLDHPNIVKVFEFFQDQTNFYIVTEFCTGGELFDKIQKLKKFSEKQACGVIKSILQAINYCHSKNIVHRDLKPENLLLDTDKDNANIKIIDFGTSKAFDPERKMNQKIGTPYYIAPEVLSREYDHKCDIWSIGVILYILLCGYPPFSGAKDNEIMEKVKKGVFEFRPQHWDKISSEAKDLISKMLTIPAEQRLTAEQCLSHPWILKYDTLQDVPLSDTTAYLNNLKTFRANQRMQQAIYLFIFTNLTTAEEKNKLMQTFKQLDTNNDGKLSRQELLEGYKKIMNLQQAQEEVNQIFQQVDFDKSGEIDYSEFVMASIDRQNILSQTRLEQAFSMFDKDASGSISIQEIKEKFKELKQTESQWNDIVKEVDKNGDGQISFKEFKEMMLKMVL